MKVLVTNAGGRTGRHVIEALQGHKSAPAIRGLLRTPATLPDGVETVLGDLHLPESIRAAADGVDVVIHYGPALVSQETTYGLNAIDAALAAGVKHFVFISVIHPQIENLLNHKAKLAIEAHLINSGLSWTIVRPQHYMQNIDVIAAAESGRVVMPYPTNTVLGHVDMRDLAEAAAKVALEPGHAFASYDIAADEHLSVEEICRVVTRRSGREVQAEAITPEILIERMRSRSPAPPSVYTEEALHRLMGYYGRRGIFANPNVLTWLLGRPPASFESYVDRCLAGDPGPARSRPRPA